MDLNIERSLDDGELLRKEKCDYLLIEKLNEDIEYVCLFKLYT